MKQTLFIFATIFWLCTPYGEQSFAKQSVQTPLHLYVLRDDAARDPSFVAFRSALLAACKKHDKQFIEQILSANVLTAIGGGKGKENFNDEWQDLSPESPFWDKMERILAHGAQIDSDSGEVHAPAVSFEDSSGDKPQGIVWNKAAVLRKSASDSAPAIRAIYNEQVNLLEPSEPQPIDTEWVKISTTEGTVGYIRQRDIYSGYDEFATFIKVHHAWCLSWFGFAGL